MRLWRIVDWGPWLVETLNAQILLPSWVWQVIGLTVPSEVQIQLHHPDRATLIRRATIGFETLQLRRPYAAHEPFQLLTAATVLPWELATASRRNRLVRDMWDRVHQAYGHPRALLDGFEAGWLYD